MSDKILNMFRSITFNFPVCENYSVFCQTNHISSKLVTIIIFSADNYRVTAVSTFFVREIQHFLFHKVTWNYFSNFWKPLSPITCVAWNAKVQHILGTLIGLPSGTQAVIWDLRKNEPIIKIQDRSARLMSSTMSWNPLEPTQFALGCEGPGS